MHSGVSRHALKASELIGAHAQRGENFGIELRQGPLAERCERGVELGAPAQNAHYDLRSEAVIFRGERDVLGGVEKFGCVGILFFDLQEDVEGCSTCGGDTHDKPSFSPG